MRYSEESFVVFDFRKWLVEKMEAEPKIYRWDHAVKRVMGHIAKTGEQPAAAFNGDWAMGDYDRPKLQDVGDIVLFEARVWLVGSYTARKEEPLEVNARTIRNLDLMNPDDQANWRMYNLSINNQWLRLGIWPQRDGGQQAIRSFGRYL